MIEALCDMIVDCLLLSNPSGPNSTNHSKPVLNQPAESKQHSIASKEGETPSTADLCTLDSMDSISESSVHSSSRESSVDSGVGCETTHNVANGLSVPTHKDIDILRTLNLQTCENSSFTSSKPHIKFKLIELLYQILKTFRFQLL